MRLWNLNTNSCLIAGYRLSRGKVCGFIRALGYVVSWLSASKTSLHCCIIGTLGLVIVVVVAAIVVVILVVGCGL